MHAGGGLVRGSLGLGGGGGNPNATGADAFPLASIPVSSTTTAGLGALVTI